MPEMGEDSEGKTSYDTGCYGGLRCDRGAFEIPLCSGGTIEKIFGIRLPEAREAKHLLSNCFVDAVDNFVEK
jgi:hypothetical protein